MRATRVAIGLLLVAVVARGEDRALLVGCTEYPNLKSNANYASMIELYGPANDVVLMRDTLIRSLRVPAANITALSGWPDDAAARPTRDNILGWLDRTAKSVRKGDRVIVMMAGHGSQQPDTSGDEPDGMDEIFLPADVKNWNGRRGTVENAITDDELGARLRAIRDAGAFVWLVMDCCHSGSISRKGEPIRARRLDPDLLGVPPTTRGVGKGEEASVPMGADLSGMVALYASPSYRTAPELRLPTGVDNADWHGMLSYTLATQLTQASGRMTYRELQARVVGSYRAEELISVTPVAEGDLDRYVGGEGRLECPPLYLRVQGDELILNAGRLAGVRPGSVLALRRIGDKAIAGHARVVTAGAAQSVCVSRDGKPLPREELAAELVSTPLDEFRVGLRVEESLRADPAVTAALAEVEQQVRVSDTGAWTLKPGGEGRYTLLRGDGLHLSIEADQLVRRLRQIYKAEALTRFVGEGIIGGLPEGFSLELVCSRGGKREPVAPAGRLLPGDQTYLRVRNQTGCHYDLTVLAVDAQLGVTELFPLLQSARIAPVDQAPLELGPFEVNDETLGIEHLLVIAVPREESDPEASFGWLAQNRMATERSGGGRLSRLLGDLAFGGTTRGEAAAGDAYASLITWQTTWGEVAAPGAFPATTLVLPAREALAAILADVSRDAWQPASARVRERGPSEVYRRAAPAVLVVRTRSGHGSGFLVGPNLVLTNHHVVAQGYTTGADGRPRVQVHRGDLDAEGWMKVREEAVGARVVLDDAARDLALLEVEADPAWFAGMEPLTLAPEGPGPGQACSIIGHPASGLLWSLRQGQVAQVGRMPQDLVDTLVRALGVAKNDEASARKRIETTEPCRIVLSTCGANPGDSGSPLLDEQGRLLGITYAIPGDLRNDKFIYHLHREEIAAFLARPREEGPMVPDPWRLGPRVGLTSSGKGAGLDLLVSGEARPEQILVDVDGDARATADALESIVAARSFDAEAAFHFLGDRRIAFYDTDNDSTFDLILVDEDVDPEADVRLSLGPKGWSVQTDVAVPWLSASYLRFEHGASRAMVKFRALKS